MKLALLLALAVTSQAFAAPTTLIYTTGSLKGKDVVKNYELFGYEDICYKGIAQAARTLLYKTMNKDSELKDIFAKVVKADQSIVYGYIQMKCIDEGETEADCRAVNIAKACK
jgi:hypothetical protein